MHLPQTSVQVGQEGGHLFVGKTVVKGGHQSLARQHYTSNVSIIGGSAAGQFGRFEDAVQVGRDLLEGQVIFLMTVGAADEVEVLPCGLLLGQCGHGMATGDRNNRGYHPCAEKRVSTHPANRMEQPMPSSQIGR